ncbi:conserved oligomeric Golgi complex subunit 7 [Eurytemora carolleeae]|uniref:conserved oligomeric Golgi complex subunit 7 n=1 Tax=Eurytemora carolleeae TaxID=1294199 RepID=UPI000C78EEB3|nr:conserved oligomeric Golgi complex subunit 7 [Eurytemora carolleeae]XP_023342816.1 conserved oligomeric Golgi complex subunit 7 [Eurytemora carolleeae]XP_023342817.1 conserved oligomeric Golgi complex subunit 7 [Eurytemora carolleeae]XP_023342818.1 conserved oligomeric Golgi complex subunit 7 [Eurytemora carolleeae]|eukprot:XP_023342815.1 conserved oligomeric Golgi complex subunit 7-like [Eurytemora affinis]
MDVAAFSGDSYDAKDWINKALRNSDSTQSKEAAASSLVMKLQLMISKLNIALEDQCQTVVQSIPRVVREAEQLQQEASLLSDKLAAVKADVERVEKETEQNMHTLVEMDRVKERLSETSRALQEADNWTMLDNQVEDAFEKNEVDVVAEKLTGMQASLRLLQHAADYQDRVDHLESLRNRLEATLSPQLVAAFSNMNRPAASRLVTIFRSMERDHQLTKYYSKCTRAGIVQKWTEIVTTSEEGVLEWLENLYKELLNLVEENKSWCAEVFPLENPDTVMCTVLTDVLGSLDPSLEFCIEAGIKLQNNVLTFLIDLRDRTDRFVADLRPMLQGCTEVNLRDLAKVVFAPYKPYVERYGELESQLMLAEMAGWTSGSKDTIEEIHSLTSSVSKLVSLGREAGSRCSSLTKGTGFPGLSLAIRSVLDKHMDRYRKLMKRLERRRTVVDDDWSVLQHCLAAIQTTGDLMLEMEELDMNLSLMFLESTRGYLGPDGGEDPFFQHHVLLLNPAGIQALTTLYTKVSGRTGSSTPILNQAMELLSSVSAELQKTTFNVMFHPISSQLEKLPGLDSWTAEGGGQYSLEADLPEFSFSPQEYITQTGEYLMTLPQHLEPYMTGDTVTLARAFRCGEFPGSTDTGDRDSPVDFILGCIAASTCRTYLDQLPRLPVLSANSTRQLGVDIGCLGDILDDLGHPLSSDLSSASALLRIPLTGFREESNGYPAKIVQVIKSIRGIE